MLLNLALQQQQDKLELMANQMEELVHRNDKILSTVAQKDETIQSLKKNVEFFVKKTGKGGSNKRDLEREIARLMTENERLRSRLLELQREFELKETELISEINKLVIELNDGRGGLQDLNTLSASVGGMSIHKMVENIKLQNELR